ncbi:MAG TPA: DUF3090 family protein [Dehalococcoidia bacterium]|nr:DUF3090 family protein [Dehalococcoidia bacterium]
MAEEQFIFEAVTELTAAARGVPGKRTFYFIAGQGAAWVRVWLEKEQLQALAAAIDQVMSTLDASQENAPQAAPEGLPSAAEPLGNPDGEFQIGRLALGHDPERDMIVVVVHRQELGENDPPTLQFSASKLQMQALSQRIKEVAASGRPNCPLCGGPVDPDGHTCPRHNGHHTIDVELR